MLGILGWIMIVVGMIWLVVTAIQTGADTKEKVIWGLVNFLCHPIGSIIFYVVRKQGLIPMLINLIGWVLLFVGGGMSMFSGMSGMP